MLDKEAQEMFIHLDESKRDLEEEVLNAMRTPEMTDAQVGILRKKYLMFLTKFEELEAEIEAHQHGTPDQWIDMWKGQTND